MVEITQALIEAHLEIFCEKVNKQLGSEYTTDDLRPALKLPHPEFYFDMFMKRHGLKELSENTQQLLETLFWFGFNACVHTIQDCQDLELDPNIKDIILQKMMSIADERFGKLHKKIYEE